MGLLLKNWKPILDIIIIAALVVLVFSWNPFGIFGGGLKLTPTTNMVTEIQEMGQLVTAEYYGEVIASIEESRLNYIESEEIAAHAADVYDALYAAIQQLYDFQQRPVRDREAYYKDQEPISGWKRIIRQDVSRRNILEKLLYHQYLGDVSTDPMYEQILGYVRQKKLQKSWSGSTGNKEEALMALYTEMGSNTGGALDTAGFIQYYYQNQEAAISRKEKRKKLAMIGRGWVKAGFDFGKMDNSTFYINDEAGEIHFFGLSAVILNADINPWFIPEKGIPGFEILDYNGKVDFRDAKKVKQYCVNKLITNAQRAKILENAEKNGAETLKSLFSLMSGKEIKKVFFHHDNIIRLSQEISSDEWVNYQEASLLDSLLKQEWKAVDSLENTRENSYKNKQLAQHRRENIATVLNHLRSLPFEDMPGFFNYYSKTVFEIARDSILDDKEYRLLEKMRGLKTYELQDKDASPTAFWYPDTLSLTGDYNAGLEYLIRKGVMTGNTVDTTLSKYAFTTDFLAENRILGYAHLDADLILAERFIEDTIRQRRLYNLLYPFGYRREIWNHALSKKNIILDSIPWTMNDSLKPDDSTTLVYHALPHPHLKRLDFPLHRMINPLILKKNPDKAIIWVSEDFAFVLKGILAQELKDPKKTWLTDSQTDELENHYWSLLREHHIKNNKGPFVRANEWIQQKFENNKSVKERFVELRQRLGG